ncbi:DUF3530 family protein [Saccharospirillum salsuginis]|uniref:DUF3530 family protein n=1 Tax=Saccharospirillum salsuginis TaxID=418750 RepID=A0A918K2B2_9GAMM|nr:DUF3530 family protein [Saccharospirillum salsuginis]GGX43424.1 hypothetical protein GCM10007392_07700 [Saccharospirillum salsuginis]
MKSRLFGWLYLGCLAVWATASVAEPLAEARQDHLDDLQAHYRNALRGDQVVQLGTEADPFLGLRLQQRTATPQGGVLILHDQGHNPNWPVRVQQTRHFLPDKGWNTLSIALPTTTAPGRESDEFARRMMDRIALGQQRLNQEGLFNIVLISFGDGAYWAARYMAERLQPDDEIGYALLMIDANPDRTDLPGYIGALDLPVLDLVYSDTDWARDQARERQAEAARNKLPKYSLILDAPAYTGTNTDRPGRTVRRIWGWLKRNAAGKEGEINTQPTE